MLALVACHAVCFCEPQVFTRLPSGRRVCQLVARALAEAEAGSVLTRALRLFRRIVCAVRRRIGVRFVNRGG
jgi:hypothetical protein